MPPPSPPKQSATNPSTPTTGSSQSAQNQSINPDNPTLPPHHLILCHLQNITHHRGWLLIPFITPSNNSYLCLLILDIFLHSPRFFSLSLIWNRIFFWLLYFSLLMAMGIQLFIPWIKALYLRRDFWTSLMAFVSISWTRVSIFSKKRFRRFSISSGESLNKGQTFYKRERITFLLSTTSYLSVSVLFMCGQIGFRKICPSSLFQLVEILTSLDSLSKDILASFTNSYVPTILSITRLIPSESRIGSLGGFLLHVESDQYISRYLFLMFNFQYSWLLESLGCWLLLMTLDFITQMQLLMLVLDSSVLILTNFFIGALGEGRTLGSFSESTGFTPERLYVNRGSGLRSLLFLSVSARVN